MAQEWLFIGGPPRSGTAITAWVVSQHPEACILRETHFATDIAFLLSAADGNGITHLSDQPRNIRMGRICLNASMDAYEVSAAMANGLRGVVAPDTRYFGDKSPQYARDWPMLRNTFPDCKLIFTDRDTDECAASIVRQYWGAEKHDQAVHVVERFRAEMQQCPDAYSVQLEDLNAEPREVISDLLDWLDLDDAVYPWNRAIKQIVDPDEKVN